MHSILEINPHFRTKIKENYQQIRCKTDIIAAETIVQQIIRLP